MAYKVQFRRGTAAEWLLHNTVLGPGEMGIESDTDLFKLGDGATAWEDLPYGGLQGPSAYALAVQSGFIGTLEQWLLSLKGEPGNPASNLVQSVNGQQGAVVLNKGHIGLGNVDNTSDASKPLSNAAVAAQKQLVPAVTHNNRIAVLGDSITAYYSNVDTTQISMPARGAMSWFQFLTHFVFSFSFGRDGSGNLTGSNYGVSGDTIPMALARLPAAIAAMKADKIGKCIVRLGTNDLTSASANVANIKAGLLNIWTQLSDAGIEPIAEIIPARTYAGSGLTTGEITTAKRKQNHVNDFIRNAAKSGSVPLLRAVVDTDEYYADAASAAGDPLAANSTDGTHPNDAGGLALAKAMFKALKPYLPAARPFVKLQNDRYHATDNPTGCINANPLMLGTAGTHSTASSGPVADSYRSSRGAGSTITIACSKGNTALDGGPGAHQIQTISANGTGASGELAYFEQAITTDFAPGDVVRARWPVKVAPGAPGVLEGFRLEVRFEGGTTHYARHLSNATGTLPNETFDGTLGTQDYVVPAGCTTIRARIITSVNGAATGTVEMKAGELSLRKVIE